MLARLLRFLLLPLLCGWVCAQEVTLAPEEMQAATFAETLSMPTPGELFAALGKVGKPDWPARYRKPLPMNFTSRAQMALNLGGLFADAYLAIEAQDAQQLKNLSSDIAGLAKPLGVLDETRGHCQVMAALAELDRWPRVREELEASTLDVNLAFTSVADGELVSCVAIGAWLRALEIVSGEVAANYSEPGARLLRQPGIAGPIIKTIAALPKKTRTDKALVAAWEKLNEVEKLVSFPAEQTPAVEQVREVERLAAEANASLADKLPTPKTKPTE